MYRYKGIFQSHKGLSFIMCLILSGVLRAGHRNVNVLYIWKIAFRKISIKCSKNHILCAIFWESLLPPSSVIVIVNFYATLKHDTLLYQTSERNNAEFEYISIYIFRSITIFRRWKHWWEKNKWCAWESYLLCTYCTVWCARAIFYTFCSTLFYYPQ